MKELTYEEWQKNPTPRMMWVWDEDEIDKEQRKVIYFINSSASTYPVITLSSSKLSATEFKHCAEIEKTRRMTNKELSRWLREKPTRECKYLTSDYICGAFEYRECKQDKEVRADIRIREDYGEWKEPLMEVEE